MTAFDKWNFGSAKHWQRTASTIVILIGCLVLAGWAFNIPLLKSVLPGLATMKANTALAVVLAGVSLWLLRDEQAPQSSRRFAQICSLAVFLIGLLTLSEYTFGWNLGIDQFLFTDTAQSAGVFFPGRMAHATALGCILLGLALWFLSHSQRPTLTQIFALTIIGIALFALTGYFYGVDSLYGFFTFASVALHTALVFLIAGAGILLARPRDGLMAVISADGSGGIMARRLLPAVIFIPLTLGWLRLKGEQQGLYDTELGLALFAVSNIVTFVFLVWWNARLLNRVDVERRQGEKHIRKLNRTLAVLSDVNQAIVRVREMPALFEKICQIAVEKGGFRAIWIGLVDPVTQKVKLVAHAGTSDDYQEILKRAMSDEEQERVPLARMVGPGAHQVFNDFQNDPRVPPDRREEARRLGYGSTVLLPLKISGEMIGLVALYAQERDFFNVEELQLMDEMGGDIAFAMEFSEREAERRQAQEELAQYREQLENLVEQRTSELSHAVLELQERERQLRFHASLQENVTDAVIATDLDFRVQSWNPAAERIYGWRAEEVIGRLSGEVLQTQSLSGLSRERTIREFMEAGHWTGEVIQRHRDGRSLHILGSTVLFKDEKGHPAGIVAVNHDISERKRAEDTLREQHDFLELVVNAVPDIIIVKDWDGRFQLVNNLTAQIYGTTPEDMLGKTDADFNPNQAEVDFFLQKDREALETGQPIFIAEETILNRYYQTSKIPLRNREGHYDRLLVVAADVTERKKAEEMLQHALEKEKELGELKSRFVSMASHEFRTPLASILAITETLSLYRQKMTDEHIEERLAKIRVQIGHLRDILDDVLQLARLQARRAEFNPVRLDLDALCRSVVDEFQSRPDLKHQLLYNCDGALQEVKLDRKLMRQIINNLVSNAIKYSPEGKTVSIRLDYAGETLVLSVRDEGIGIPEADLKHLFEPFHRASNVETIPGTGLGLVIIKESVELHGGTITVESAVGVGTTFTVRIPVAAKEETKP